MNLSMITAANSFGQIQHQIDTLSHNVANVNTTGYKRRETSFQDLLTENIRNQPHAHREVGRRTPYGIRVGHGVKLAATSLRTEQGAVRQTDRPLDFMIEGDGWFRILHTYTDADGNEYEEMLYTRDGNFHAQPHPTQPGQLRLVTAQGLPVLDTEGEEITFADDFERIQADEDGTLNVYPPFGEAQTFTLGLARIHRPDILEAVGENGFRLSVAEEELLANGGMNLINLAALDGDERPANIRQGALEMSNVDLTQEMTNLITAQRLLQFQSRAISMADEMMGLANSIRG